MPRDSKYIPLAARATLSSSGQQNDLARENLSSTDVCSYPLSTTTTGDSKGASGSCILRPPKPKEDLASTDVCIYPLSTTEEQTLDMFGQKHASQCIEFDSESLMVIINNIFHNSNFDTKCLQESGDLVDENILDPPENIRDVISQISFGCSSDADLRETAFQILDVVMDYTWEAKMVLILAALVKRYGGFCLALIQQTHDFLLTKYLHKLEQPPFHQTRETLSSNLMPLSNLVKKLLEVCTIMLQIKEGKDQLFLENIEPKVTKVIHNIIYEVVKIGVACSSYMEIVNKDIECITSETEIKRQKNLLKELLDNQKNLNDFISVIDSEAAQNFTPSEYLDIRKFFNKLFKEEKELNRETVIQIGFEELHGYTTAFLVSDINIRIENFTTLVETHHKVSTRKKIRIVWIPLVDQTVGWTDADEKSFNELANLMPWCCCHPSMVTKSFSTHVVKSWQYKNESSLIVLNEKAEVITHSLSVVETWGDKAYPFSSTEMITTISKNWTIKRMVEDWEIDQLDWENDIVCIYGGDSLEMTRSFSQYVQSITNNSNSLQIKAIYVGTNGEKENLQNIVSSLEQMNVKCLSMSMMSSFWNRLAIILNNALDEATVMKQLPSLLCYSKEELWTTMIYKESTELIKPTGTQLLQCLEGFNGSNKAIETTDELWKCLIQITKPENLIRLAISASACERVRDLFGVEHQDVSDVLSKVFIKEKGIFDGQTDLEHLKGKAVGFLITKMDTSSDEFTALIENFNQNHQGHEVEIIWIPIVDTSEQLFGSEVEKLFPEMARSMKWYYCQSSMLTNDFSSYIRQDWYSQTNFTLVVLSKKGRLVSTLQWDASTFPWEYRVDMQIRKWTVYCEAKELNVIGSRRLSTVSVYDGIRDDTVDVVEILAPCSWTIRHDFKGKLVPNTIYESIFVVMLTDTAQGWGTPVELVTDVPTWTKRLELFNNKPRGVWFDVQIAEFVYTKDMEKLEKKTLMFKIETNDWTKDGILVKCAGIREKRK